MPDKPVHRCLVCDTPHHAQLWLAPLDLTDVDMHRIISTDPASPAFSLRPATGPEQQHLGLRDPDRQLWISQHSPELMKLTAE